MNLYEFNQNVYASLPPLDKDGLKKAEKNLIQYLTTFDSNYYMLLNNESRYYTLFTYKNKIHDYHTMASEILSIVKGIGTVKGIERNGPVIEFWIMHEEQCKIFMLFDYERGVVRV